MAESIIFIIVAGFLVAFIWGIFGLTINPSVVIFFITLLIIPGMIAAFTAPFVPSGRNRQRVMMKLAKITGKDIVYDLGCGDGRLVFDAAKNAKKAIGYELSIPLWIWGRLRQLTSFKNVSIRYGDMFKQDYSQANVIFCYLLPGAISRFENEIWKNLKPGTRVISNGFQLKQHKPKEVEEKVYLYVK